MRRALVVIAVVLLLLGWMALSGWLLGAWRGGLLTAAGE